MPSHISDTRTALLLKPRNLLLKPIRDKGRGKVSGLEKLKIGRVFSRIPGKPLRYQVASKVERDSERQAVEARREDWQKRGLMIFYLPPYSPNLNMAEILWRELKYEWLQGGDYLTTEGLYYKVRQALSAAGRGLKIQFSDFSLDSTRFWSGA